MPRRATTAGQRMLAVKLLGKCSRQRVWEYGVRTYPGYSDDVREVANSELAKVAYDEARPWWDAYAIAAERCRLRTA